MPSFLPTSDISKVCTRRPRPIRSARRKTCWISRCSTRPVGALTFWSKVLEALADRAVGFLADTPLPAIREALDRLRSQAHSGAVVTDVALLRRLILKHCVFGVDLSPMGAEVATLSLGWRRSYRDSRWRILGRNILVGIR